MGLNNKNNNMVVLNVCFLLVFLVGVTTARMDLSLLKSNHHHSSDESSEPCCDSCICSYYSQPRRCECGDIRLNSCHSACKSCICDENSEPALCLCADTTEFCYKPCESMDGMNKF
ncbi:Bowman-Birk type proteinase inhibitor 2, partial [Mucuna pruriens]